MQSWVVAVGAVIAYGIYNYVSGLLYNISEAKRSGLPYIILPWSPIWVPWQITHKLWLPLIKLLPKRCWEGWLSMMMPNEPYRDRIDMFERYGTAVLIVSPQMLRLLVANAEAINYMTSHREQFRKWIERYGILRFFGDNIVTVEGSEWRIHRKVTAATFNERNNALVFREAVRVTQGMLFKWMGPEGRRDEPVVSIDQDTLKVALQIISYVGFGLRLLWPDQPQVKVNDDRLLKYGSWEAPPGYTFCFTKALTTVLENFVPILILPRWFLKWCPSKALNDAGKAREEFGRYIGQMLDEKIDDARSGEHMEEGMDLMGQMARSCYSKDTDKGGRETDADAPLTRDEILGNAFIMFLAGHETTANVLHFTMLELAANPTSQRHLQRDIEAIFGSSDPSTWDYDVVRNQMDASMLAACFHETMRVIPPVVDIPKKLSPKKDEPIFMDGQEYIVPKNTAIGLQVTGAHHLPRYWQTRPSKIEPWRKTDIRDYIPERWFPGYDDGRNGDKTAGQTTTDDEPNDYDDLGGPQGPDTSAQLYRPPRGSFIPFSDGARSCLGRRIAQVEVLVALAVLFREYSLELAVDEWATQEEVKKMSKAQKEAVYKKAQDDCRYKIERAETRITLRLQETHVPVRVVRRGEEQFVNWLQEDH